MKNAPPSGPLVNPEGKKARAKLPAEIKLLRAGVAAAERHRDEAKEQARQAKRRQKVAKLLAKRARKAAKQAKAKLEEARTKLAEAEALQVVRPKRPALRLRPVKCAGLSPVFLPVVRTTESVGHPFAAVPG